MSNVTAPHSRERSRRQRPRLISLLLGLALVCPALASAVSECDRLAGHRLDPDGVVFGVSRSAMDLEAAEKACREAVATYPGHARSNYQLGRVLYYAGRGKESVPYLQSAADAGYPQALFVLGYIQIIQDQVPVNYCAAADLWLRAAALDHPFTGVYLTTEYLKGSLAECDIELSDAQLKGLEHMAITQIAYADSEGRIEEMQALLAAHFAKSGAAGEEK